MHQLLTLPHHDGSSLYVEPEKPALGEPVALRLRVPADYPLTSAHVRIVRDGEPQFVPAREVHGPGRDRWFEATVIVANPLLHYRWIIGSGPTGYTWLNAAGLHARDVTDAGDFRISTYPSAAPWSENAVVYQIFPDRFARAELETTRVPGWAIPAQWDAPVLLGPREVGRQLYGGNLDGIIEHLDHIVALGATVVYLTPIFPAISNHRYDASTFDRVDPILGGDAALERLASACHARGLRLIGDFTTNHTGVEHEWFVRASTDPSSIERRFYIWSEHAPGGVVCWLDVASLPKLNYDSPELFERLFGEEGPVRKWLRPPYNLDGWRVDVANMTGRYLDTDHYREVACAMRHAVAAENPDALLVAEHCHDLLGDLDGDGWQGAMNYAGVTRPLWTWLRDPAEAPTFLGVPLTVPRLAAQDVVQTMRDFNAEIPWQVLTRSFNLTGSHDTMRVATLTGGDHGLIEAAAVMIFTLPGIPMVTYGDEIGMEGEYGEDGRRPMPWGAPDQWDTATLRTYQELAHLRTSSAALIRGGLRWVWAEGDTLGYLRETDGECLLVAVARRGGQEVLIPAHLLPEGSGCLLFGAGLAMDATEVALAYRPQKPGAAIWKWEVSR